MSSFDRTLRSLKIWWNHITREPDEGDIEAKDPVKFVAATPPDPRSWSDGGITLVTREMLDRLDAHRAIVDAGSPRTLEHVLHQSLNRGAPAVLFADERDPAVGVGRLKNQLGDFPGEKPGAAEFDLFAYGLLILEDHVIKSK